MDTPVHEETYKEHTIKIRHDDDGDNPRGWDNLGTMACWHSQYTLGDEQPSENSQDFLLGLAEIDVDYWWDYYEAQGKLSPQEIDAKIKEKMEKDVQEKYIILPLYLYDHSGISMSTSSFIGRAPHAAWDSGQVGFIYISRDDAKKEYGWKILTKKRREQIEKYLTGEVSTYDCYLRGDVYGYTIEGELTDDSCWGFYPESEQGEGVGYAYCLKEAQGVIDYATTEKEVAQIPVGAF